MSERNDDFDSTEPLTEGASKVEPPVQKPKKFPGRPRGRPPRARHVTTLRQQEKAPVQAEPPAKEPSVKEPPPLRRFWKPKRSLPSVEWDQNAGARDGKTGELLGAARFEFRRGLFETRDQELAEELIQKGYLEIPEGVTPPLGPPGDDLPAPEDLGSPQQITAREVFAQAKALAEQRAQGNG